MGSFGERLRREREMRGITLDEIAEATKIGSRLLLALETEEFEKLPGGIFNKGFVRAYARFLGIDEEQAIADYLAAVQDRPELAGEPSISPVVAIAAAQQAPEQQSHSAQTPWPAFIVIFAIAAIAAGGWYVYRRNGAPPEPPAAEQPATPAARVPAETAVPVSAPKKDAAVASVAGAAIDRAKSNTSEAAQPKKEAVGTKAPELGATTGNSAGFVLHIRALQDSWMKITADGAVVTAGETMKASSERDVRADKQIILTIGNAGGIEISHNGKGIPTLGPENKTRTVTFTPQGLQQ